MNGYQPNLIEIIVVVATIGLIPLAVVTLTGFMKISVVLFLIRNALGVQQTPPNMVLYGIALILSVYVTTPLIGDMYRQVQGRDLNIENIEQLTAFGDALRPPLQAHLARFANESERGFLSRPLKPSGPPKPGPTCATMTWWCWCRRSSVLS